MPKLNTTIDNLELKENKIINSSPSSDWTDDEYPSARTLYNTYNELIDLMHPVGSVLCMSENKNPAEVLGGVWELVDKEFEYKVKSLTDDILVKPPYFKKQAEFYEGTVNFSDHNVLITLYVTVTDPTDTSSEVLLTSIGQIDYSRIGLPSTLNTAKPIEVAISSNGLGPAACMVSTSGWTVMTGILDSSDGAIIIFNDRFTLGYLDMPDELCNKFYFKRIA